MSQQLISHSSDLKALEEAGFELDIVSGHLVVSSVPYVNNRRQVKLGRLISTLDLAGDVTTKPSTHVVYFEGEYPCDSEGRPIEKIRHASNRKALADNLFADHSFSTKPPAGYANYHEKMSTYVGILSAPAQRICPSVTAQTRRVVEAYDEDEVFEYLDTASSRAGITAAMDKLKSHKIGIIGLGGTGSYVLDLLAKTPVREIHLFDGDEFLQHNAFRAPGATSIDELKQVPKKVHYHARRYAQLRRHVIAHEANIDKGNLHLLEDLDFVFLCLDRGDAKKPIVEKLEELDTSFIDVGMGLELPEDRLLGMVRVTASTPRMRVHVRDNKRFALSGNNGNGVYTQNIQIVELNALNAALAVIKWKKLCEFYSDSEDEHFSVYNIAANAIANEDTP